MSDLASVVTILQTASSSKIAEEKLKELEDTNREEIKDEEFLSEDLNLPSKCPSCGGSVIKEKEVNGEHYLECENGDMESVDPSNHMYYDVHYDEIARIVSQHLDLEISDTENKLPDFMFCEADKVNLVIMSVVRTGEESFLKLFRRIIKEKKPALIITTDESIEEALEIQSVFSAGSLTYIIPAKELVDNIELGKDRIEHMEEISSLQDEVFEEMVSGSNMDILADIEINPKHLISYLNHLRLMKESEGKFDWKKMEELTSTAFSRLFVSETSEGGGQDSGGDVPDNLFLIREGSTPYITGIVDTKSNYKAKLNKEKSKKHLNYFDRVNSSIGLSGSKKCLLFVIFDIQGETDLEFYGRVKDNLGEDEYVLVMELDAIITMLEFYISICVSNKLKFRQLDLNEVFKDIFDEEYLELNDELRKEKIRESKGSNTQEELDKKILQANHTYYISDSFVKETLNDKLDEMSDLEGSFDKVFEK